MLGFLFLPDRRADKKFRPFFSGTFFIPLAPAEGLPDGGMGKKSKKKPPAAPSAPPPPPAVATVATESGTDTPRTDVSSWPSTPGGEWAPPSASKQQQQGTAFERALASAGLSGDDEKPDDVEATPQKEGDDASKEEEGTTPAEEKVDAHTSPSDAENQMRAKLETTESRFEALRADFHYNLALLKDRDTELETQDEEIASLKRAIAQRDVAAAELDARLVAMTTSSSSPSAHPADASHDASLASVERARIELAAHYDENIRAMRTEHAAELERERQIREDSFKDVEDAKARARDRERAASSAIAEATRREGDARHAESRANDAIAEAEARVSRKEERADALERERSLLAETKQRLLDEYEEKCEKLVGSMRDVENHFETVQRDRERAERERTANEEEWGDKIRELERKLSVSDQNLQLERRERVRCEKERDELVELTHKNQERSAREAAKASGLRIELDDLKAENRKLQDSLAFERRKREEAEVSLRSATEEADKIAKSLSEAPEPSIEERERRHEVAMETITETHARDKATWATEMTTLRTRAEKAEAELQELRREYAARTLATSPVKPTSPEVIHVEATTEVTECVTVDLEPPPARPPPVHIPPVQTTIEAGKGEEYWRRRFDVAASAVSAVIDSFDTAVSAPSAPSSSNDDTAADTRDVPVKSSLRSKRSPVRRPAEVNDDGSSLRERMRSLRADLSAAGVDTGRERSNSNVTDKTTARRAKGTKASSPRLPRASKSSGHLTKALRALKARPRMVKKRATTKIEMRSAPTSFSSHHTAFGRTTLDPLPGTYPLSPPKRTKRLDAKEQAAVRRLIRPKTVKEVCPTPHAFHPRGFSRALGAKPKRPPHAPFEPPHSFRAPTPPSPTPLDDETLTRLERHWDKENARHRYASVQKGDNYFALSPASRRWTTGVEEDASREGIGPAKDLIAAGEDRLAALERRRREHHAMRKLMHFDY